MMLVGARGNTARQLMKVMRIPISESAAGSKTGESSKDSNSARTSRPTTNSSNNEFKHYDLSSAVTKHGNRSPSVSSTSSNTSLGSSNTGSSLSTGTRSPARCKSQQSSRYGRANSTDKNSTGHCSTGGNGQQVSSGQLAIAEKSLKSRQLAQDGGNEARHREFLMLTEQLLHGNHEIVHRASFIYLDKGTKRTERYKAILKDYYETKPKKVDFDNVDLLVKTVNEDVARTTENIYHEILTKAEAQQLEKSYMLLVNAVFFRGFWLSNFTDVKQDTFYSCPSAIANLPKFPSTTSLQSVSPDPNACAQKSISCTNSKHVVEHTVQMMSKLDYLPVVSDEHLDAKIIRMPFEASDLEMLLILPNNQKSDASYLCQKITAQKLQQIENQFSKQKCRTVKVTMPIFCVDSGKISIQSTLVSMGAGDLFDKARADLTGVCENKHVWLHKILHRCFIICDNRGSITSSNFEKAQRRKRRAEQVAGISSGRSGVLELVANHPFMYMIIDSVTKTILLIGLFTDPSESLEVIHENQLSPDEANSIYSEGLYKTD